MPLKKEQGKIRIKRSSVTGVEPTLGPSSDHTDGTWSGTDCYAGEFFLNKIDEKLWIMLDDGPRRIGMNLLDDEDTFCWVRDGEDIRTVENEFTSPVIYPNILPSADDQQDIGSSDYRWKDIYLGSMINFATDVDFTYGGTNDNIITVDQTGILLESTKTIRSSGSKAYLSLEDASVDLRLDGSGFPAPANDLYMASSYTQLRFIPGSGFASNVLLENGTFTLNNDYTLSKASISGSTTNIRTRFNESVLKLANNEIELTTDDGNYAEGFLYLSNSSVQLGFRNTYLNLDDNDPDFTSSSGFNFYAAYSGDTRNNHVTFSNSGITQMLSNNSLGVQSNFHIIPYVGVSSIILGKYNQEQLQLFDNSALAVTNVGIDKGISMLSTNGSTVDDAVVNSVILGGTGLYATSDDTAYVNQLGYGTNGTDETLVSFTTPTGSNSILFPDASGTLALLSDITPVNNILVDFYTTEGNSTTTATDAYSYTLPANTLANNGDKLIGSFGGNINNITSMDMEIQYLFDGNIIFDTALVQGTTAFEIDFMIIRVSSTVFRYTFNYQSGYVQYNILATGSASALDFTTTNIMKFIIQATGVTAATNDITMELGTIEFKPAA